MALTLRQRVAEWIGGSRDSTPAIPFHPGYTASFGPGIGNQPSHQVLLRESMGVADTATRAIANRVATLDPLVKITRGTGATKEDETLDGHPLKRLLDRPHPNFTRSQMLRLTTQWIVTTGEAYWLKVGSGLNVPVELHPVPPWRIEPVLGGGIVTRYKVRNGDGRESFLSTDVVVRFFMPDPENPWTSEGYLGPNGNTADTLKFAGQHLRGHYEDDATPKTVLKATAEAESFTDDQRKRFLELWRQHQHARNGSQKGLPVFLPSGYELIQMLIQTGTDIVPLLDYLRDDQLLGFGVARSVLGQVVSGDRSSAETNFWVFDKLTISPLASLISDAITLQLAPDFDPSIFVEFDGFVSEDKNFELLREKQDLETKVRSINQVLTDRDGDPVPWGEIPVGKLGEIPYDPDAMMELPADAPGALGDGAPPDTTPPEPPRKRMTSRVAFFDPEQEWLRQVQREKRFVPSFRDAMQRVFKIQRDMVLERLHKIEDRVRITATMADLFDLLEWSDLFKLRVEPIRERAFREIAKATLSGLGVDGEFVMTDAMVAILRQQGAELVRNTNRTTQRRIANALEQAILEGEGVDQAAARIVSVFKVRRKEARTIARTEILKASQESQLTSFDTSGVVERKQWNTSRDESVRDSHVPIDGQIVALREAFTLGDGERADAPGIGEGGTSLSAGNAINCRCFVTPVMGEE